MSHHKHKCTFGSNYANIALSNGYIWDCVPLTELVYCQKKKLLFFKGDPFGCAKMLNMQSVLRDDFAQIQKYAYFILKMSMRLAKSELKKLSVTNLLLCLIESG